MAQFDVYRVRGRVLVLDCQADLLADLPTRFVVPLRPVDKPSSRTLQRLNPILTVNGKSMSMATPLARSIDVKDIEGTVTSLAKQNYEIKAALDMLIIGY